MAETEKPDEQIQPVQPFGIKKKKKTTFVPHA